MYKVLLFLILILLWGSEVQAGGDLGCTRYSPAKALEETAEGNVNTFSATYSMITERQCDTDSQGGGSSGNGNNSSGNGGDSSSNGGSVSTNPVITHSGGGGSKD